MNNLKPYKAYHFMFKDFPDVVNIKEMCEMLGKIGVKTAYELIQDKQIKAFKIGREYRIPKICVIEYLLDNGKIFEDEFQSAL